MISIESYIQSFYEKNKWDSEREKERSDDWVFSITTQHKTIDKLKKRPIELIIYVYVYVFSCLLTNANDQVEHRNADDDNNNKK